jgi:hypothetical protein
LEQAVGLLRNGIELLQRTEKSRKNRARNSQIPGGLVRQRRNEVKVQADIVGVVLCGLSLSAFSGCGSSGSKTITINPSVTLAQSGTSTTVDAGVSAISLTATVLNDSTKAGVSWTIAPATGCGAFASSGLTATYTPPAETALNANCKATITATSKADTAASANLALTVDALSLTLPGSESNSQTAIDGEAGLTLSVNLANDASGTATVNWSLSCTASQKGVVPANAARPKLAALFSGKSIFASRLLKARGMGIHSLATPEGDSGSCGSLSATSGDSVTYTPPDSGSATVTITAAASINSSVAQVFTVTDTPPAAVDYTVGGTVSGLGSGASAVLLDNGGDATTVSGNEAFTFATALASGTSYLVTVGTQPTGEVCIVSNGGPASISANVTNVAVKCAAVSSSSLVAQRALAQTGLAVALASNVLQSQLEVILLATNQSMACQNSTDGTVSADTGSTATTVFEGDTVYPVNVFYGNDCAKPYIAASITGANGAYLTEAATYYRLDGAELGVLSLNESVVFSNDGSGKTNLYGYGLFTPASGARTPVQLGLYCDLVSGAASENCAGAVAQDFSSQNIAIGAVTPLILVSEQGATSDLHPMTFSGTGSVVTGALGSLTLTNPSESSLVISGGTAYAAPVVSGSVGSFDLFPPTPTSWTLTDTIHDQQIAVSVVDDTTRDTSILITQISTGNSLASGTVDQSGTGSITYSDSSMDTVTNWTLGTAEH